MNDIEILQAILTEMREMKQDMSGMKQDIQKIDQRTAKLEVSIENEIRPTMKLMLEGQQGMNEQFHRLSSLEQKVEDIQTTVEVLRFITVKS